MPHDLTHGESEERASEPSGDRASRREDLLAAVLQDVREPIATLRRALAALAPSASPAQQALLEELGRGAAALAGLADDLAALEDAPRCGAARRSRVDLAALVEQLAERLAPVARARGAELVHDTPPFPVTAQSDGDALRGALEALATRTLAAAPPGAVLALRVEGLPWGGRIALDLRSDGDPRAVGGGAVALVLAREHVERCGGVLQVRPGGVDVAFVEEAQSTSRGPSGDRPRLLLVEDDDATREALAEALVDHYDVEPVADGIAALEAARARPPDLVLMDLYLPRLDGFSALEALRGDPATLDVPVILVSGRGDDLTRARSLDLGAVDFLQKPFSERELRARIERTLRLARRQSQLQALAETDALTGLANRRAFRSRLALEVKRARRYDTPLACLMVDMDHLKPLNDEHGHAAGDRALAALAGVLRGELRETDLGARYGGDEFVVLLPHTTAAEARALAERICERVRATAIEAGGRAIPLAASFGIAELPPGAPEDAADAMLRRADTALYETKRSGRGHVTTWTEAPAP